ncbi:MAG: hypothetical protein IKD77_02035 [Bacilli bacterium]|nr:hypothetical protein [Bacilli bacterium]MBR3362662.1 hypothetical protein [Bacilli bacterium]
MNKTFLKEYKKLKKKRSLLLIPGFEHILTENFSYTNYLKDAILSTKGIYTGYFDGYNEIDISKLLSENNHIEKKETYISFHNEAEKKLQELAEEYYLNIDSSSDEELDKTISSKMVETVNETITKEKKYNKNTKGRKK